MQKLYVSFSPNLVRILRFSTSVSSPSPPDFLSSYLVAKRGFSPGKSTTAVQLFSRRVSAPDQPESVISFFKSNGFDDSHLKTLFSLYPGALSLSVEETLACRFHTFRELGFTGNDLATLVCSNPSVLRINMEDQVVPKIKLWRSLLGSHSLLMKCLTRSRWDIFTTKLQTTTQNISLLRECGLLDHQISVLLCKQTYMILQKPEFLNELIHRVESLGMPRGSSNFHWALFALNIVGEENLQAKVELFKGFGWSEKDFSEAFCKAPIFFTSSSKMLEEKMEFFVNEAGCPASYIALNPGLLCYSLKKRLIPRLEVVKALKEKGLDGGNHKLGTIMSLTNNKFFERYVAPYKEKNPELCQLLIASS